MQQREESLQLEGVLLGLTNSRSVGGLDESGAVVRADTDAPRIIGGADLVAFVVGWSTISVAVTPRA